MKTSERSWRMQQPEFDGMVCASLSERDAPVDLRALAAAADVDWLAAARRRLPAGAGVFVLETCNRLELYVHSPGIQEAAARAILETVLGPRVQAGVTGAAALSAFRLFTGHAAALHLCRVAAGLESKVFGESEILGQVTRAYRQHVGLRALDPALDALLRAALRCGKRVRHETPIGAHAGSIGALAVRTVEERLPSLDQAALVVVGLGEMGSLVARRLAQLRPRRLVLINRTFEHAQALAQTVSAGAAPMADLVSVVKQADAVIFATAAREPVLTAAMLADGCAAPDPARRKLLIDLAVPRDVELAAGALPGYDLLDIDRLQVDLDVNLAQRHTALPQAEAIVDEELARLGSALRELAARPLVVDLRCKAEEIRKAEVERTLRFLRDVNPETREHLERLTHGLVNKLLHTPTTRIRDLARDKANDLPEDLIRDLFGLHAATGATGEPPKEGQPAPVDVPALPHNDARATPMQAAAPAKSGHP